MGRIVKEKEGNEHGLYQGRYCTDYNNRTMVIDSSPGTTHILFRANECYTDTHHHHHHHHHKHQGLGPLIRPGPTVTAARANASSVFQLFSFLVVCSGMISKGFGFVAFFAGVKASSVSIYLPCLVYLQSVVRGVCSHLFCGHKGCSLPEVSVTSFLPLQTHTTYSHYFRRNSAYGH